jgi:hypothetical protein
MNSTAQPRDGAALQALAALMLRSRHLVVLTGAGCSTESGIPDYRDRARGLEAHNRPCPTRNSPASLAARQTLLGPGLRSVGVGSAAVQPGRSHQVLSRGSNTPDASAA